MQRLPVPSPWPLRNHPPADFPPVGFSRSITPRFLLSIVAATAILTCLLTSGVWLLALQATPARPFTAVISTVVPTSAGNDNVMKAPNFAGLDLAQAQREILQRGLVVGTIMRQPDPNVKSGVVIGQQPLAGDQVVRGTRIDLTVSE